MPTYLHCAFFQFSSTLPGKNQPQGDAGPQPVGCWCHHQPGHGARAHSWTCPELGSPIKTRTGSAPDRSQGRGLPPMPRLAHQRHPGQLKDRIVVVVVSLPPVPCPPTGSTLPYRGQSRQAARQCNAGGVLVPGEAPSGGHFQQCAEAANRQTPDQQTGEARAKEKLNYWNKVCIYE